MLMLLMLLITWLILQIFIHYAAHFACYVSRFTRLRIVVSYTYDVMNQS